MIFDEIKNNDGVIHRLIQGIVGKGITHAYIFEGDQQSDKAEVAKAFAKGILCLERPGYGCHQCISCLKIEHDNHEDLFMTQVTEKGNTKDEEISALQDRISKKPCAGARNIAIIRDADSMTKKAQNRLLKTLEEPPTGAVIMLLSSNTENLPSTILSRCVIYRINPFREAPPVEEEGIKEFVKMLLHKEPFYKLKNALVEQGTSREEALSFLDNIQIVYRNILLQNEETSKLYKRNDINQIFRYIEEARRDIQLGVNPMYSLKNMALKIGG